jgi:glutaredoxin
MVKHSHDVEEMRYGRSVVTVHTNTCDKCKRANPIDFRVEPEEAWRIVVLNRWKKLCPLCFDQLAEMARVQFKFVDVEATSWSDRPVPQKKYGRRR